MKKNTLLLIAVFSCLMAFGQNENELDVFTDLYEGGSKLSAKAGYLSLSQRLENAGDEITDDRSGFYAGVAFNFGISPKFDFQTELLYANGSGESDSVILPFLANINLTEKLILQTGPQFVFALERQPTDVSGFQFNFGFGARYNMDGDLFIDARYAPQFSNSYRGQQDITLKNNIFSIGLGYTLN